jgi:hypothetical protein
MALVRMPMNSVEAAVREPARSTEVRLRSAGLIGCLAVTVLLLLGTNLGALGWSRDRPDALQATSATGCDVVAIGRIADTEQASLNRRD